MTCPKPPLSTLTFVGCSTACEACEARKSDQDNNFPLNLMQPCRQLWESPQQCHRHAQRSSRSPGFTPTPPPAYLLPAELHPLQYAITATTSTKITFLHAVQGFLQGNFTHIQLHCSLMFPLKKNKKNPHILRCTNAEIFPCFSCLLYQTMLFLCVGFVVVVVFLH